MTWYYKRCYYINTMNFCNLKVKTLTNILKHTPSMKQWQAKDRQTHIIGIQLRGNMYHDIGEGSITLTENCLFFFNQRDDFHAYVRELGESYTIHFTTYEPIDTESFVVKTQNAGEAIQILDNVERALRRRNDGENLAMSEFYRFCHLLEKLRVKAYHQKDERIAAAKKYFDLNFRETDIRSAAEMTGLSRRRFNDLFKEQYGITPNDYLTELKINAAKSLLVDNGLSVKSISELCGFNDHYYFCKVFKSKTGFSPTAFKKHRASQ